jgi:hypothetical protein
MAWEPDYVDVNALASYMRIEDDVDDVELQVFVTAASRAIDQHCNRQFGKVAAVEQRLYTPVWSDERQRWVVDVDDFQTAAGMIVEVVGTGVALTTDYVKEPVNAPQKNRPWTRLAFSQASTVLPTGEEYEIAATVLWGWTAIPVPVTLAARLQGSRFAIRRDSPYGVAGSPDTGSEMRLQAELDPDVKTSLTSLRRRRKVG